MELTQAYLKECFDYDPETGNLIWKERPRSHFKNTAAFKAFQEFVGCIAGSMNKYRGYRRLNLVGREWYLHRLVWFWHHGRAPVQEVDHIDRDRKNNRIENLRECSKSQNRLAGRSRHTTGSRGVQRRKSGRWQARIRVGGRKRSLGTFATEKDAALAYARAAIDYFGAFAPIEAKELFNEAYP